MRLGVVHIATHLKPILALRSYLPLPPLLRAGHFTWQTGYFFSKPDSHTDHCLTNFRPFNDFGMLTAIHVIFLVETRRCACASTLPRLVALQQQPQQSARDTRESRIASQNRRFLKDRLARIGRNGRETNIRPVAQLTGLLGLPERQKGIPETKACVRGSKQTKHFPDSRART